MLFPLQKIDPIHRRIEAHTLALLRNPRHRNRCCQVRLSRPRATDEHPVLRRVGQLRISRNVTGDFAKA